MSGHMHMRRMPWADEDEFTGKRQRALKPWEYEDVHGEVFVNTEHLDHVLALDRMHDDERALQERGRRWLDGAAGLSLSDRVRLGLRTGATLAEDDGGAEPR